MWSWWNEDVILSGHKGGMHWLLSVSQALLFPDIHLRRGSLIHPLHVQHVLSMTMTSYLTYKKTMATLVSLHTHIPEPGLCTWRDRWAYLLKAASPSPSHPDIQVLHFVLLSISATYPPSYAPTPLRPAFIMHFLSTLATLAFVHMAVAAPTPVVDDISAVTEKRQFPEMGFYVYFKRDDESLQLVEEAIAKHDAEKRQYPEMGYYVYFKRDDGEVQMVHEGLDTRDDEKRQYPEMGYYVYFKRDNGEVQTLEGLGRRDEEKRQYPEMGYYVYFKREEGKASN